uniref:Secreted protein n=1 Tax=Plectus sambesii TaxID=2011161 RepID=A0A914UMQ5_9BILA
MLQRGMCVAIFVLVATNVPGELGGNMEIRLANLPLRSPVAMAGEWSFGGIGGSAGKETAAVRALTDPLSAFRPLPPFVFRPRLRQRRALSSSCLSDLRVGLISRRRARMVAHSLNSFLSSPVQLPFALSPLPLTPSH